MFNPVTKSFKDFDLDPSGLPFGMEFDSFGNLWIAQHTLGKLAVLDPQSGLSREINIPNKNPFVQWLTADSKGNIWMAEQGSNVLRNGICNSKSCEGTGKPRDFNDPTLMSK